MDSGLSRISALAKSNSSVYENLPGPRAIRLLAILPPDQTGKILCSLVTFADYMNCPQYCALSYCWDHVAEIVDDKVVCDKQNFSVTVNLYKALARLYPSVLKPESYVWVDAICINQNNDHERSRQVALMKEIYSNAAKVYVWLGDIDEETYLAIELIREIANQCCAWYYGPGASSFDMLREAGEEDLEKLVFNPGLEGMAGEYWLRLRPLLLRPWFQRIWVVQEIQNSSDAWMLCGSEMIHWKIVAFVIKWFDHDNMDGRRFEELLLKTGRSLWPGWGESRIRQAIFMTHNTLKTYTDVPFLSVFRWTRPFQASDPRDKIFAAWILPFVQANPGQDFYLSSCDQWCRSCEAPLVLDSRPMDTPMYWHCCRVCTIPSHPHVCDSCFGKGKRCPGYSHTMHRLPSPGIWFQHSEAILGSIMQAATARGNANRLYKARDVAQRKRLWFTTGNGHVGCGHNSVQIGDIAVVLFGARVPFLLRPQDDGRYLIVGDCYVHGMMDGEAIDMLESGELDAREYILA